MDKKEAINEIKINIEAEKIDNLIGNSYYPIEVDGDSTQYRIRKATIREKQLAEKKKSEKFSKLLVDDNVLSNKQILEGLQNKGIVSLGETNQFKTNQEIYLELMRELGQVKSEDTEIINKYKEDIKKILIDIKNFDDKVADYLANSLENQVKIEYDLWVVCLCSEKLDNNKWGKVWESFDEFDNDSDRGFEIVKKYYALQGNLMDFIFGGWLNPQSGVLST